MFSSKKPQPFQGWPETRVEKEKVTINADYRSPDKIEKGGIFSGLGAIGGIAVFFMGVGDAGPLGAAIVGGIVGYVLHSYGESLKEKVTIEFTEELIRFNTGGWEWKEFKRKLPHPFKMEGHEKAQEEAAKEAHERKGPQKRLYRDSYHVFMDHLNGAYYLPDIYEKKKANMLINRLQGVDEYMKTFRAEDRSSEMAQDPYKGRPGLKGLGGKINKARNFGNIFKSLFQKVSPDQKKPSAQEDSQASSKFTTRTKTFFKFIFKVIINFFLWVFAYLGFVEMYESILKVFPALNDFSTNKAVNFLEFSLIITLIICLIIGIRKLLMRLGRAEAPLIFDPAYAGRGPFGAIKWGFAYGGYLIHLTLETILFIPEPKKPEIDSPRTPQALINFINRYNLPHQTKEDSPPKNEEEKASSKNRDTKKTEKTNKNWKDTLSSSRLSGLRNDKHVTNEDEEEEEEEDPEFKGYGLKHTYKPTVTKRSSGDPWDELDSMIGLGAVKEQILKLMAQIETNNKRAEEGLPVKSQNFHMVFTGNPGTGKTTVARILSDILYDLEITSKRGFIETDRSKIIGPYVGEAENKLNDIIRKAKGRVLFFDEAYAMYNPKGMNDAGGKRIIDRLTKALEDGREDFIAILAGYEKEMEEFLKGNPGLESRIPIKIHFPDYSEEELFEIFEGICQKENYVLDAGGKDKLKIVLNKVYSTREENFANGRVVRNIFEECLANQSLRLANLEKASKQDLMTIQAEDIPTSADLFPGNSEDGENDPWVKLEQMIGLEDVKSQVKNIVGVISNQERRKEMGLPVNTRSYHMIFTGNPGTGKTTVARIMSELLFNLGVSKKRGVIELDRSQMVGQFVGHTENKINEILKKVQGKILFVDEAYALYSKESSSGDSDGKKIVDRLNKALEDDRDKFIAIFAGYEKEMTEFLKVNPGLDSRFPLKVHFPDYTPEELVQIFDNFCREGQYVLEPKTQDKIKNLMANLYKNREEGFGNGRTVRNIFEKVQERQSVRTSKIQNITKEELIEIKEEDIPDNL